MTRIKLSIQRPWIPYIVLIVSLTTTLIATYYVGIETYEQDHLRFLNAVQDTTTNIETHMQTYIALLRGTAGLFAADPNLSQQQFMAYVTRLNLESNYPGTQGIGLVQQVDNNNIDEFIQTEQAALGNQFTINPPGNRAEYYVVSYYVRRDKQDPSSLGQDMYNNPIQRKAMDIARDTGLPTASQKISSSNNNNIGFSIYVPLYSSGNAPSTVEQRRANLVGFVYSPFQMNVLLAGILGNRSLPQLLNYQIYDGKQLNSSSLLHNTVLNNSNSDYNFKNKFSATRHIPIAGRIWTTVYSNNQQFDAESENNFSLLIFVGGLFISILFFVLSRSQYVARKNAEISTIKLRQSQLELQKALSHRDNFISIASHELKTPVTSLKVYAEVLLQRSEKKGDKETTDYLTKIIRQIDKLTMLIQDLLNVTRIQSNQLTFRKEKFDLTTLVEEVVETTQQIDSQHEILIHGKINKKIWGDSERISQVITNLLTNALKYSPKSHKVIVGMKESEKEAIVSVRDYGIGVGKEHQKKIFDRFYRISEQTYPGLGIGLYISQSIIKRHGGVIAVISHKGKGSTFQFALPYTKKFVDQWES
jgi:signal transduction histidine kinase